MERASGTKRLRPSSSAAVAARRSPAPPRRRTPTAKPTPAPALTNNGARAYVRAGAAHTQASLEAVSELLHEYEANVATSLARRATDLEYVVPRLAAAAAEAERHPWMARRARLLRARLATLEAACDAITSGAAWKQAHESAAALSVQLTARIRNEERRARWRTLAPVLQARMLPSRATSSDATGGRPARTAAVADGLPPSLARLAQDGAAATPHSAPMGVPLPRALQATTRAVVAALRLRVRRVLEMADDDSMCERCAVAMVWWQAGGVVVCPSCGMARACTSELATQLGMAESEAVTRIQHSSRPTFHVKLAEQQAKGTSAVREAALVLVAEAACRAGALHLEAWGDTIAAVRAAAPGGRFTSMDDAVARLEPHVPHIRAALSRLDAPFLQYVIAHAVTSGAMPDLVPRLTPLLKDDTTAASRRPRKLAVGTAPPPSASAKAPKTTLAAGLHKYMVKMAAQMSGLTPPTLSVADEWALQRRYYELSALPMPPLKEYGVLFRVIAASVPHLAHFQFVFGLPQGTTAAKHRAASTATSSSSARTRRNNSSNSMDSLGGARGTLALKVQHTVALARRHLAWPLAPHGSVSLLELGDVWSSYGLTPADVRLPQPCVPPPQEDTREGAEEGRIVSL